MTRGDIGVYESLAIPFSTLHCHPSGKCSSRTGNWAGRPTMLIQVRLFWLGLFRHKRRCPGVSFFFHDRRCKTIFEGPEAWSAKTQSGVSRLGRSICPTRPWATGTEHVGTVSPSDPKSPKKCKGMLERCRDKVRSAKAHTTHSKGNNPHQKKRRCLKSSDGRVPENSEFGQFVCFFLDGTPARRMIRLKVWQSRKMRRAMPTSQPACTGNRPWQMVLCEASFWMCP